MTLLPGDPTCCLPCPATSWTYPNSFDTYVSIAEWLNVVGLILLAFMLVSYIVLPAQKTRSHYLSICLIVSVLMVTLGFTIPLAAQPEQCYDKITPNDMYSLSECAWSGAFIVAGGLSATVWIFIRALSMNLQICFDIVPGQRFFYGSQALGWGIPAALFTATMTATGVSFRFGSACHVNHVNSMKDFWGPLLGFAGAAGVLQIITFGYCINVYLRNLWSDQAGQSTQGSSSGLPSYNGSVRTQTARAVYQRLKKVLWLQWRGISIVTIILVDVVFFSIVFVYLDDLQNSITGDWQKIEPWLACLVFATNQTTGQSDKGQCLYLVDGWLVNQPTVIAVLLLLSLAGIQVFLFLTRPSIFPAWIDFFKGRFRSPEFVSLDARQDKMRATTHHHPSHYDHLRGHQTTTFEMQKPKALSVEFDMKSFGQTTVSSPDEAYRSPLVPLNYDTPQMHEYGHGTSPSYFTDPHTHHGLSSHRSPPNASPDPISPLSPPPGAYHSTSPIQEYSTSYRRGFARQPSMDFVHDLGTGHGGPVHPSSSPPPSSRRRRESSERRYNPPNSSFSAPISRQSSTRSNYHVMDAREAYSRGGLGLNPPSEIGESEEDSSSQAARPTSPPRR